jgi:predicted DNA-binding transcriptional regulator YafY
MPYTTMRVLTMLELLQSRRQFSGPELAERLEINVRTVRRYMTTLQDLGFPVETVRGRYGAYRLRAGYKLPPLMFTDDEALAVVVSLLAARRLGLGMAAPAIEGAISKVERVLPAALRDRVRAVQESVVVATREEDADLPAVGTVLVALGAAARQRRRVWLYYRSYQEHETKRALDPYGLVYRAGRWYVVGYCHLRRAMRVFRLDRIVSVEARDEGFERPADFDALAEVERGIAQFPYGCAAEVVLCTTLDEARRQVPATMGRLEVAPEGVLLRCSGDTADGIASHLTWLRCDFTVRGPPEVRAALRRLAARLMAAAGE